MKEFTNGVIRLRQRKVEMKEERYCSCILRDVSNNPLFPTLILYHILSTAVKRRRDESPGSVNY